MRKKKICFVAPNAYPLLKSKSPHQFIGGAEFQQVLIGDFLQRKGYEVSFVTLIWGGEGSDEILREMKIFKTYARQNGVPFIRFFYPRFFSTWKALKRADADIYYQRGASSLTGIVALFCSMENRIFLFSGAHDRNFIPSICLERLFDKELYSWGLRKASHILVQSYYQKKILLENYHLQSTALSNIYAAKDITKDKKYILWVGNIKKLKRPTLFIDIAKQFPLVRFVMIGGSVKGEERLYNEVVSETKKMKNIDFLGFKPLEDTEMFFDGASLFINTAEMEGFPNTFLQAWARGIPTISFIDIDGIVSKNNLGVVVKNIDEIKTHLDKLLKMSLKDRQRIREYVITNHSPEVYVERIDSIICDLIQNGTCDNVEASLKMRG